MSKKILCNQIKPEFCELIYGKNCAITKSGASKGDCRKIVGGPILEGVDEKHLISYKAQRSANVVAVPQRAPNVLPQRSANVVVSPPRSSNVVQERAPNVIVQPQRGHNVVVSPQKAPNVVSPDTTLEELNSVQFHFPEERDITEGSETESLMDVNKKQLVEISGLITEKQFNDVFNTKYIQTYIKLRKPLSKSTISFIIALIRDLYKQIQAIKSTAFSKSEIAREINELLTHANLCRFIPGEKEQLLEYASDLGLPITSNTDENVICYVLLGAITADIDYTITKMIEKKYFNPDKKGLPDRLSDLTPQEIASIIDEKVVKLNGPIYGALLVPKEEFTKILGRVPPVFWLLGDFHVGNKQCETCPMGTCFTLYKNNPTFYMFLSTGAKELNVSIDLFLEYWINPKTKSLNVFRTKSNSPQDSALIESSDLMIPCVGQRKENELRKSCFFTEFRTHNADIRKISYSINDKHTGDAVLHIVSNFTKKKTAAVNLRNAYPGFNVYQELLSLYSAKDNVETINRYFNSPFFKKYSRTLHEFYKLPKDVQSGLMERLLNAAKNDTEEAYMMSRDSSIRTEMFTALRDFITDNTPSNESKLQLSIEKALDSFLLSLGATLVDIYTLSRALKDFKGGLPSQLSVVYQGNLHIQRQISLLKNYYDVVQRWDSPQAMDKKCISRQ
jgi:hypothetical protein